VESERIMEIPVEIRNGGFTDGGLSLDRLAAAGP
jgi:hypothetical protein